LFLKALAPIKKEIRVGFWAKDEDKCQETKIENGLLEDECLKTAREKIFTEIARIKMF
jgi:hypothetical protein